MEQTPREVILIELCIIAESPLGMDDKNAEHSIRKRLQDDANQQDDAADRCCVVMDLKARGTSLSNMSF